MIKRLVMICILGAVLLAGSALAEGPAVTSYGFRAGFSSDPNQLVLGGQMSVGEVAPNLSFDPNIELGFGDNVTLIAFNLDMHYHFTVNNSTWRPYVGAGAGINLINVDAQPPLQDDTRTEVGGQIILGAGVPTRGGNRFFSEMKFGLGDIPSFKLLVGWNFGH
jgi:hypothetical protein